MKFLTIIILIVLSFSVFSQTYTPNNSNWLYNVRGAAILYYNTDDSTFYPVQGDTTSGGLTVLGPAYASFPVFTDTTDTMRLTNTAEIEGRWIPLSESYDGAATLFVGGDSISGAPSPIVTVSYQLILAIGAVGDTLLSEKFTLGTVDSLLLKDTIGDGNIIGETFIMGNDTEWTNAIYVKFFYLGTGTQVTIINSTFKRGR